MDTPFEFFGEQYEKSDLLIRGSIPVIQPLKTVEKNTIVDHCRDGRSESEIGSLSDDKIIESEPLQTSCNILS